jgi:hypothetical protein
MCARRPSEGIGVYQEIAEGGLATELPLTRQGGSSGW